MNPRIFIALLPLLLLAGCRQAADPASTTAEDAPAAAAEAPVEETAPAADDAPVRPDMPGLQVATVAGGSYDLAEQRGEWVVENSRATWCSPCPKGRPELPGRDTKPEHASMEGRAHGDGGGPGEGC